MSMKPGILNLAAALALGTAGAVLADMCEPRYDLVLTAEGDAYVIDSGLSYSDCLPLQGGPVTCELSESSE